MPIACFIVCGPVTDTTKYMKTVLLFGLYWSSFAPGGKAAVDVVLEVIVVIVVVMEEVGVVEVVGGVFL